MKYTLENGKIINIPDTDIENSMVKYEISKDDAIQLWLDDNDLDISEEYAEVLEKTKGYKVEHQAYTEKEKKEKKPRTHKNSDEKIDFFNDLSSFLIANGYDFKITTKEKEIMIRINDKFLKINISQATKKAIVENLKNNW